MDKNKAECITSSGRGVEGACTWLSSVGSRGKGWREKGGRRMPGPPPPPDSGPRPPINPRPRPLPTPAAARPKLALIGSGGANQSLAAPPAWGQTLYCSAGAAARPPAPSATAATSHHAPGKGPGRPRAPRRSEEGRAGVFLGWPQPRCRSLDPRPKGACRRQGAPSPK